MNSFEQLISSIDNMQHKSDQSVKKLIRVDSLKSGLIPSLSKNINMDNSWLYDLTEWKNHKEFISNEDRNKFIDSDGVTVFEFTNEELALVYKIFHEASYNPDDEFGPSLTINDLCSTASAYYVTRKFIIDLYGSDKSNIKMLLFQETNKLYQGDKYCDGWIVLPLIEFIEQTFRILNTCNEDRSQTMGTPINIILCIDEIREDYKASFILKNYRDLKNSISYILSYILFAFDKYDILDLLSSLHNNCWEDIFDIRNFSPSINGIDILDTNIFNNIEDLDTFWMVCNIIAGGCGY